MLQRYRLRLGDGTILQVDKDGLRAWVDDDRRAVVQIAGTSQWRPLREFLQEEESAARLARALVPPEPRRPPSPPPRPEPRPAPEPEPRRPAFEAEPRPAFEPEPRPAFEPEPRPAFAPEPRPAFEPEPRPAFAPEPSPAFEPAIGAPPVQALAEEPSASTAPWQPPVESSDTDAPPIRLKQLEDEPHTGTDDANVVVEEPQDPYAVSPPLAYAAARVEDEEEEGEERARLRLEGPLLQVVSAFGTLLSRLLDPLTPLVRDWPTISRAERAPRASARRPAPRPRAADASPAMAPPAEPPPAYEAPAEFDPPRPPRPSASTGRPVSVLAEDPSHAEWPPAREELPVIRLKPLEEDEGRVAAAWQGVSETLSGWAAAASRWFAGVSGWVTGLWGRLQERRERNRPQSVVPRTEPTPRFEPAPRRAPSTSPRMPASLAPSAPMRAPTPIAELPSIRLADGWEPADEGDVYGDEGRGWGILAFVWMWTQRIVLVGGLVALVVFAALNWKTWFPRAAEIGQSMFTEIDRQARSTQRTREHEQAVASAVARCPHLGPATIELVLSTSERVLEPPEVFQVATEAADRGIGTLPPAEAAELRELQQELVGKLTPPQRARLAEYDRARATRAVFAFENPPALDLVARGARAMTDARRGRLQVLLARAVAAGLPVPSRAAAGDGASR